MLIGIDANEANISKRVGINYYAYHLLHALYHQKSSHHFRIYLKNPPLKDLPPERKGWDYRVIPFPKLWTQTRLPIDLYLHQPRPDVFLSLTHYAPRFSPVPLVISIMDLGYLLFPGQFTPKDLHQLTRWTNYSVKKASKVIAISENTKKDIIRFFNRAPGDIVVTHLAHDPKIFHPQDKPQILDKYGIKTPFILFVSSLKPSKNIEGLVAAFSQLNLPDHQLVIAGKKAWMYQEIFDLVSKLGLEEKVVFTDYLPQEDIPPLMTQASVFVLPSFYEGFALPALEAMACGCPVVVSRVANLPEVVGQAVVYVDPYNIDSIAAGIKKALAEHDRLSRASLSRAKKFSWDNTAKKTISVLESFKM